MTGTIEPKPSKAKTYFTIDVGGKPRTLFAVREGKTHDGLTIIMKAAESIAGNRVELSEVIEQRYSLHDSPQSPDENTIKHTLKLADNRTIDTHKQTKGLKGNLLTPLFFRTCPSLDGDRYLFAKGPPNERVSLGQYDHTATVLHYGVFASANDGPKMPGSRKFNMVIARFREFTLYVPYCFTNFPSSDFGATQHLASSAPRIDREPMEMVPPFIDPGLPPLAARALAHDRFSQFHEHVLARAIEDEPDPEASVFPFLIHFLKELGPGLLKKDDARQRFSRFMRKSKGVLPSKDVPRKLDFDLSFATLWIREKQ